jgi:hypothetical protein
MFITKLTHAVMEAEKSYFALCDLEARNAGGAELV